MRTSFCIRLLAFCCLSVCCYPALADRFVVIKFQMPEQEKYITYLFDSQGKRCKEVLNHLYARYSPSCEACKTINNACMRDLPFEYSGVFEAKPIAYPYMILEDIITKAVVYDGFGNNTFSSLCTMQKQQEKKAICVPAAAP